ncbi:MAG: hypothetical protein ACKOAX_03630 [Candidatus Kapaibacterium sp.]
MNFVYLIIVTVLVFFITVALVVIGQEVSVLLATALFAILVYGSLKLVSRRLTKL